MKNKKSTRTVLQIPLEKKLKTGIEIIAKEEGFDSVQAFTRLVFTKIVNGEISFRVMRQPVEYISPEYEEYLNKREQETLKAIEDGTAYTASSGKEFIDQIMNEDIDEEDKV